MSDISHHEPLVLSAGDSLKFNKNFPQYLPSAGWVLNYQIRGGAGKQAGLPDVAFASTPDATNTIHQISVTPETTAKWSPGEYILAGYAVNAGTDERREIYENTILISPNFNLGADNVAVQTFAQQMVIQLQNTYAALSSTYLLETNVQQTLIVRKKQSEVLKDLLFWYEKRANEVAIENVRNGRPSGQKIRSTFNVVGVSPGYPFSFPFVPR